MADVSMPPVDGDAWEVVLEQFREPRKLIVDQRLQGRDPKHVKAIGLSICNLGQNGEQSRFRFAPAGGGCNQQIAIGIRNNADGLLLDSMETAPPLASDDGLHFWMQEFQPILCVFVQKRYCFEGRGNNVSIWLCQ